MESIRTALVGTGYRGKQLARLLQEIPAYRLVAVADPRAQAAEWPGVACYNQAVGACRTMLDECRPQLLVVASPWQYHVEHALQAVESGCDVALEIKGGLCLHEYAALARLAVERGCRIFPLENTLFMREVLAVQGMVQAGLLGEIVYMRGGYRHDLRNLLLDDHGRLGGRHGTESVWRGRFYQEQNADIYPTHGLAPLCLMAGIGRRERVKWLTAFASKSAGIRQRVRELGGGDTTAVRMGDVIVTQLETEGGILLSLTHDTTLPRPRSLDFEVQGTKGIWQGDRRALYIEGLSPEEAWEPDEPYLARYEHPYWRDWGEEALRHDAHHRGMDYIMLKALEADLRGGTAYPATVDDLALWTSVTPLSGISIAEGRRVSPDEFGTAGVRRG